MNKKRVNQLRVGVVLSYVNLALGSLIPMFYTPVMLQTLGTAEHGLYSLANSTVGYLSLLGFGFGSTIIRYMAKFRAENDQEAISQTYGFFLKLYSGLSLLVLLGGAILTWCASQIFANSLTVGEVQKIRLLIPILSFHTAITFPLSVFNSLIISHERYLYRRVMDILATLLAPVCNLFILFLGFASVGLALSSTLLQIVLCIPNVVYCTRVLGIRPSFKPIPRELIREILGFSGYVFLGSIVDMLFWATDKVILGMLVGSAAVSVYQIGGTFNSMVMQLSSSISGVLAPKITGMVARDAPTEVLSELFNRVGRVQFLIVALIVSGFAAFGRPFIQLWAGEGYRDAYWITVLTLFPLCVPLIQNTGLQILMAQNRHKFRSVLYFIIAILNVISTWLIIPYMGGIGAALCSCISYLLGQGLVMNAYYYKVVGINIPQFWKEIGKLSTVPAILMLLTLVLQRFIVFDSWLTFFAGVIVYTGLYGIGMYCFCMNGYEKALIQDSLNKIILLVCRR